MTLSLGKVYIVGAGPGSPELITLRGAQCLKQADVVMYDRLAHPALLLHAPPRAKLIYCGKKPCAHTLRQEDIQHEMMIQAKQGKTVVRLKGGDPGTFGRMAEELEELNRRHIPYEIIPGITAASAASSYAGVSLTRRSKAHGYRVLTGHGQLEDQTPGMDWTNLADTTDTLIWYMGMKRLPFITEQLLHHGKSPNTHVLVVEWAASKKQRCVSGALDSIVSQVKEHHIHNPSIIIIGEVTRQHEEVQWFFPGGTGGILAFPQNSNERNAFEQLKAQGLDVFITPLLSEDSYLYKNNLEILDRLLEEGFIRHTIIPSTKAGTGLYERWMERNVSAEQPLTWWRTEEQSSPFVLTSLLPALPLENTGEWEEHFLSEENLLPIAVNGKESV